MTLLCGFSVIKDYTKGLSVLFKVSALNVTQGSSSV